MIECKDAIISTGSTYSIRSKVSPGVGDKISKANFDRIGSFANKGIDTGNMQDIVGGNNKRAHKQRSYTPIHVDTAANIDKQSGTAHKREDVAQTNARE